MQGELQPKSRIYVAGHRGLVGSAIVRRLRQEGFEDIVTAPRGDLDLLDRAAVERFFEKERPEFVFLAAALAGGIYANETRPGDFLYENLTIQCNVIDAAYRHGVQKLLFLGSSCIYPRLAPQPISERSLLTGPLEATNQAYAIAKIAGVEMCRSYRWQYGFDAISVMPTNLYGPGDKFDLDSAHVIPALMRKAHEAKQAGARELVIWGTGRAQREFLYIDDLADAVLFLMRNYDDPLPINVGLGQDMTIRALAEMICEVVGFEGQLAFDATRPDGTPRKLLDVTRMTSLGWSASTALRDGLGRTYAWYLEQAGKDVAA
jgi:GDP-L-fucose synthase